MVWILFLFDTGGEMDGFSSPIRHSSIPSTQYIQHSINGSKIMSPISRLQARPPGWAVGSELSSGGQRYGLGAEIMRGNVLLMQ